jgi:hypothetical protein
MGNRKDPLTKEIIGKEYLQVLILSFERLARI